MFNRTKIRTFSEEIHTIRTIFEKKILTIRTIFEKKSVQSIHFLKKSVQFSKKIRTISTIFEKTCNLYISEK